MAQRRTKENKQKAKHPFLVNWSPSTKQGSENSFVKRQLDSQPPKQPDTSHKAKKAYFLDKDDNLAKIKRDIIKSLILTSLILGIEIVLYLA